MTSGALSDGRPFRGSQRDTGIEIIQFLLNLARPLMVAPSSTLALLTVEPVVLEKYRKRICGYSRAIACGFAGGARIRCFFHAHLAKCKVTPVLLERTGRVWDEDGGESDTVVFGA